MTDFLELLPKFQFFNKLCSDRCIKLDPENGDTILFQGQRFTVIAAREKQLALIDEFTDIPIRPEDIQYIHNWDKHPHCYFIPGIEYLLEFVFTISSNYPVLTPGIETGRKVWQIKHPNVSPIVAIDLQEALLELCIRLLQTQQE